MAERALLEVRDLRVHFPTDDGLVKAVDGVSYSLDKGRTLGIVGESGSGKPVSSLTIMGLQGKNAQISGEIWLGGRQLVGMDPDTKRRLRGNEVAMIFQDPQRAVDLLGRVGIPQPSSRVDDYPHQFSGGMRQRAMIAMALSCNPELLIADEPTTALDVTVQAQILDLILDLQQEFDSAVIIITHDLGVVAELADDIMVMYAGRSVEYATAEQVFSQPEHPYTWGLLGSMPRIDLDRTERLLPIPGTPPSLIRVPEGCAFHPRCAYAHETGGRAETDVPELREIEPGHQVACHLTTSQRQAAWERLQQAKSEVTA